MIAINKFSACLPGIEEVKQIDDKTFEGRLARRLPPWCFSTAAAGDPGAGARVTALVYECERYVPEKVQILGVSVEPAEEGRKLRERVSRDCQEDRPHIPLDPYPLRLLIDPDAKSIRAVGAENEGHWAGLIAAPITYVVDPTGKIRWAYISVSAADRPNPVGLARAAVAAARGEILPADYPGKT